MEDKEVARAYPQALNTPEKVFQIEELKKFRVFEGLADTLLKKIQPYVLDAAYRPDQVILREGEYSDAAYYVLSGVVEVVLTQLPDRQQAPSQAKGGRDPSSPASRAADLMTKSARDRAVGQAVDERTQTLILSVIPAEIRGGGQVLLEKGEIFGEISALSRYPVSATVRARSDVECLMIRTPALRILQRSAPKFKEFVDRRYRERSLETHLRNVGLFAQCSDRFLRDLKERVKLVSFEPGELIVEEGAPADSFFMVRGGYVKVSARSGASDLALTYLRKGDFFGEAALLLEEAWPFSFSAIESVELVELTREDFQLLLKDHPEIRKELWQVTIDRLKQRG